MRTRKTYTLKSPTWLKFCRFNDAIKSELIKFNTKIIENWPPTIELTLNISDDMITEVEELIHNVAKKCGVRIE